MNVNYSNILYFYPSTNTLKYNFKQKMIKIKHQVKLINKFPFYKLKIKRKNNGTFG